MNHSRPLAEALQIAFYGGGGFERGEDWLGHAAPGQRCNRVATGIPEKKSLPSFATVIQHFNDVPTVRKQVHSSPYPRPRPIRQPAFRDRDHVCASGRQRFLTPKYIATHSNVNLPRLVS